MVFWAYFKGRENWLTKEKYNQRLERHRNYYRSNPIIQRSASLKSTYGITHEEYEKLFASQGNKCAICGTEQCPTGRFMCVDHDHTSGKVRGILCSKCNHGIGLLRDNVETLKNAIDYLRRYSVEGRSGRTLVLP
jgi:hypothetical protein